MKEETALMYIRFLEAQNEAYEHEIASLKKEVKAITSWMKYHRAKEKGLFEMLHGVKLPDLEDE